MAPLQDGLQVVSAASRNARTCCDVQPYGTFLTYSSRFGLLDCKVAVAVAVAALCAANANPCAAPPPPTAGALATPPSCAPRAPWNANAWPDWAMFMPAICFMICSFAKASCTLRLGFSRMTTVNERPCGTPTMFSSSLESLRRRRRFSSGRASGMPSPRRRRLPLLRERSRRRRPLLLLLLSRLLRSPPMAYLFVCGDARDSCGGVR
mmetsp:Transcript_27275/g.70647  ORF Transcript_27275/g.70647 Transcript_27275/m.70647 type:complete len:208 (-) Transcript_27275:14-637(-)